MLPECAARGWSPAGLRMRRGEPLRLHQSPSRLAAAAAFCSSQPCALVCSSSTQQDQQPRYRGSSSERLDPLAPSRRLCCLCCSLPSPTAGRAAASPPPRRPLRQRRVRRPPAQERRRRRRRRLGAPSPALLLVPAEWCLRLSPGRADLASGPAASSPAQAIVTAAQARRLTRKPVAPLAARRDR